MTVPEAFRRFGMPVVRFLSRCPPAGLLSPCGGFLLRNRGPLNLWGHLGYQVVKKALALHAASPPFCHLNFLLPALLFFIFGWVEFFFLTFPIQPLSLFLPASHSPWVLLVLLCSQPQTGVVLCPFTALFQKSKTETRRA